MEWEDCHHAAVNVRAACAAVGVFYPVWRGPNARFFRSPGSRPWRPNPSKLLYFAAAVEKNEKNHALSTSVYA